jgi:hypothetical protein
LDGGAAAWLSSSLLQGASLALADFMIFSLVGKLELNEFFSEMGESTLNGLTAFECGKGYYQSVRIKFKQFNSLACDESEQQFPGGFTEVKGTEGD